MATRISVFICCTFELGHVLGFGHDDGVMAETLGVGERHLPVVEHDDSTATNSALPVFTVEELDRFTETDKTDRLKSASVEQPLYAESYDYALSRESFNDDPVEEPDNGEPIPYIPEDDLEADEFFSDLDGSLLDELLAI